MARGTTDRGVRSLELLMTAQSSSRVLNLLRASQQAEQSGSALSPALFQSPVLNRSFILKHRLRQDEVDDFDQDRFSATKIVFPIDPENLGLGGQYVFIDQRGFEPMLADAVGIRDFSGSPDVHLLRELDRIPSFDPFVFREWMTRIGRTVDARYFDLMPSLISGMEGFVLEEINLLVSMSLSGAPDNSAVLRLARKMLASKYDHDLTPLQLTLRMSQQEFQDGIFGWKGLLYYKWLSRRIASELPSMLKGLVTVRPHTHLTSEQAWTAAVFARQITATTIAYHKSIQANISAYDDAYNRLTRDQDPTGFREFLLRAPHLFIEMGDLVSMLEHTTGFWRYRSKEIDPQQFIGDDYLELLGDLREGLGITSETAVRYR